MTFQMKTNSLVFFPYVAFWAILSNESQPNKQQKFSSFTLERKKHSIVLPATKHTRQTMPTYYSTVLLDSTEAGE